MTTTIKRHGITLTLKGDNHPATRYVNGDWAIKLPVEVLSISPASDPADPRRMHGAMIDPSPAKVQEGGDRSKFAQGYDSSMYGKYGGPGSYLDELNAARALPLTVDKPQSLVCSVSRPEAGIRPQLRSAAVFTFVEDLPDGRSFRPAYSSQGDKAPPFHWTDIDWRIRPRLPIVGTPPARKDLVRSLKRVWLDHVPDWLSREQHPVENMPAYGRDLCATQGLASLYLCSDVPTKAIRQLMVCYLQLGIDLFGVASYGGGRNWPSGGGHGQGRKWPILFAGLMFADRDMATIGGSSAWFLEDGSTFHVDAASVAQGGGYTTENLGMPEWGNKHSEYTSALGGRILDDVRWNSTEAAPWLASVDPDLVRAINQDLKYRRCCTANAWWAQALACLAMGAEEYWGHPPFFDYLDRYREEEGKRGSGWQLAWDPWALAMWDAHRPGLR